MGEIGANAGTSYPGSLDTGATVELATDFVRLGWGKDVEAAIVAIEAELGTDPAGSAATVAARLDQISNSTGGGVPRGLASARPAASAGVLFLSTDIGILEYSDGTSWFPLMAG